MKKQDETLNRLEMEIQSALNGFHQEIQRIFVNYEKSVTDVQGVLFNLILTPKYTEPVGNHFLLSEVDIENLKSDFLNGETEEVDAIELDEEDIEEGLQLVSDKLLNSNEDVLLGYRNTRTNSVLFAPHPILQ